MLPHLMMAAVLEEMHNARAKFDSAYPTGSNARKGNNAVLQALATLLTVHVKAFLLYSLPDRSYLWPVQSAVERSPMGEDTLHLR